MGDSRRLDRNLEVRECHYEGGNQVFMLTGDNEIREKKFCLDATIPGEPVKLLYCNGLGANQKWIYDEKVTCCQIENDFKNTDEFNKSSNFIIYRMIFRQTRFAMQVD